MNNNPLEFIENDDIVQKDFKQKKPEIKLIDLNFPFGNLVIDENTNLLKITKSILNNYAIQVDLPFDEFSIKDNISVSFSIIVNDGENVKIIYFLHPIKHLIEVSELYFETNPKKILQVKKVIEDMGKDKLLKILGSDTPLAEKTIVENDKNITVFALSTVNEDALKNISIKSILDSEDKLLKETPVLIEKAINFLDSLNI